MLSPLSDQTAAPIDLTVLDEAADWMMRLQSGDMSDAERQTFNGWRVRSAQHTAAWQRAENIMATFGTVPPPVGQETLRRLRKSSRRDVLQLLGMATIAAPLAWVAWRQSPWREWTAAVRTATGEQKRLELADGTQLILNTASAVDVDITATERRILLHAGEVLITTGRDPSPTFRPFVVQTLQGTVRALGTRFCVQQRLDTCHVAVFEHAVEIRPLEGAAIRLDAGQRTEFSTTAVQPARPADASVAAWEQGMLVARSMRMADLIDQLGRYRTGVLRCHPDVAELPVSGAFSLRDIDTSLALLQKTLPVRVVARTRYWVTVEPAV